jgi:uncharacterized protein YmfQ (DUF2313 family)
MRLGGGPSRAQVIYDSLNQGLGTAYDTSDGSTVTGETAADARSIESVWSANTRMQNQWDPFRMVQFIPRWEEIFGLVPGADDSDNRRRGRIQAKFQALGGPIYATIEESASAILGDAYVGVEYTDLAHAVANWPGGSPPDNSQFNSSVCHILVRVEQPGNSTTSEFVSSLNDLTIFLGVFLPTWVTFDWGLYADNGMRGFYLDENNLDYETFD